MFTFSETVGLAKWIIDDTCLVLFCFFREISTNKEAVRCRSLFQVESSFPNSTAIHIDSVHITTKLAATHFNCLLLWRCCESRSNAR